MWNQFNLINEIQKNEGIISVTNKVKEYLNNNSTLSVPNSLDNILDEIKKQNHLESYFLISGYCKDWLIVCQEMILTEFMNVPNKI